MFLGLPTQPTCARAWVAAATAISSDIEAYNVVIDVDNPTKFDERDNAVIGLVDTFFRDRDLNSISTITNTIFPETLFRQHGAPKLDQRSAHRDLELQRREHHPHQRLPDERLLQRRRGRPYGRSPPRSRP